MATEKQIAANGRNAVKSTGPRTTQGKARSARNSFKHGLLAEPALLPDEDEVGFREFMDERVRELDPVGPLEGDLAEQIAFQLWRLNRFPRVEAGLFIGDRAERDKKFFSSRMRQFEKCRPSPDEEWLLRLHGYAQGEVEITDEVGHAEASEDLLAAEEATRSELALLGSAFSSAATNGDPFGKLSRYETAALNRFRRLLADFAELQARRRAEQIVDAGAAAPKGLDGLHNPSVED